MDIIWNIESAIRKLEIETSEKECRETYRIYWMILHMGSSLVIHIPRILHETNKLIKLSSIPEDRKSFSENQQLYPPSDIAVQNSRTRHPTSAGSKCNKVINRWHCLTPVRATPATYRFIKHIHKRPSAFHRKNRNFVSTFVFRKPTAVSIRTTIQHKN